MGGLIRHHPTLGEMRWNTDRCRWESIFDLFPGCPIRFAVVADDERQVTDPSNLFEIGSAFLSWARKFEPRCREKIADDLLNVIDPWWADKDCDDSRPPQSRAEFVAALRLGDIWLHPSGASQWWYETDCPFDGFRLWLVVRADGEFCGKTGVVG